MATIKLQSESDLILGQYYEFDPESKTSILGKGGMGIVFKGKLIQNETGKYENVAIKVLFKDLSEDSVMRARREASIQIVHENIVRMYGFIETSDSDGKPKYHVISEYLEGEPLSELLKKRGVLPQNESLAIVKNVLAALYMLHSKGYVHRDIDPSNVMVCSDRKIKLIDFGIAKKVEEYHGDLQHGTLEGKFIGKVNYASPEQAKGEHWLTDARSDIYSVGILLFELVTGKLPFEGTTYQIIKGHLEQPIPEREIPTKELKYIITKATNKNQKERYQSASEFIVAIEKGIPPIPIKKWILVISTFITLIFLCMRIWFYKDANSIIYEKTLHDASDNLSVTNYKNAFDSYRAAYKIKKSDSIASVIGMLELLNSAVKEYKQSEYVKADSLFKLAAEKNSSDAYYYLGEMCYEGIGLPKDFKRGYEYTSKAAKLGSKLADYRLGLIYKNGLDVKIDINKAAKYFENAGRLIDKGVEAHNAELIFVKGTMYLQGNGVQKNENLAFEYFVKAAAQNFPQAQYALFEMLIKTDKTKAMGWLVKSANLRYPRAEYKLGELLIEEQKFKEGLAWVTKAANQNYSLAYRLLGAIYQDSENNRVRNIQQGLGIKGNDSISHAYTQRAVDYDFDNYRAMYELAIDFAKGKGTRKNIAMAEKYFEMAKHRVEGLPFVEVNGKRVYDENYSSAEQVRTFDYKQYLKQR